MRPYRKHPWRPAMPATRAAGNAWPASSPSRLPALVEGQYQCTAQRRRVRRVVGIGQRVDHRRRAGIEERRIGVSEVDGGEVHARFVEEAAKPGKVIADVRSEEPTSELQSLMRNSYAVFCMTYKNKNL